MRMQKMPELPSFHSCADAAAYPSATFLFLFPYQHESYQYVATAIVADRMMNLTLIAARWKSPSYCHYLR